MFNFLQKHLPMYFTFNGRLNRSNYFYHLVIFISVNTVFVIISILLLLFWRLYVDEFYSPQTYEIMPLEMFIVHYLFGLYILGVLSAVVTLTVRRLHDMGKNGWFTILIFIPYIRFIAFVFILCTPGNNGNNKYGPQPK